MKLPKIIMTIIKEEVVYGAVAHLKDTFIDTQGDNMEELKFNIVEAVNLAFEDKGLVYGISDITLKPDLHSFFDFYKMINTKALGERINMDRTLLKQYINGEKKPSVAQTKKIFEGVQRMGKELATIQYFF